MNMTIAEWARAVIDDQAQFDFCYIAIIPVEGPRTLAGTGVKEIQYSLEIEVDEGTIAAEYHTNYPTTMFGLEAAREDADLLDIELSKRGVRVFRTRTEWDAHLMEVANGE